MSWSQITTASSFRASGGRRAFNTKRKRLCWARRFAIARLYAIDPAIRQAELARHFGVGRSTICKDVDALAVYLSPHCIEDLPFFLSLHVRGVLEGNTFDNVFKSRMVDTPGQIDGLVKLKRKWAKLEQERAKSTQPPAIVERGPG